MADQGEYEFEVAFSFLKEDEIIAFKVNDLIQDRVKSFIYSKNQGELVGFDGEQKFHEVFGEKARMVIIFYRQNWGQTPWTRIEMTAIKNRSMDNGYEFAILVPLDKSALPIWIPKTNIWFDFERWGPEGLATLIESKLSQGGVDLKKIETAVDFAKRKQRKIQLKKEIESYLQSELAYKDANAEFSTLFDQVKVTATKLRELGFTSGQTEDRNREIAIKVGWYALTFFWSLAYANSLIDSYLLIRITRQTNDWEEHHFSVINSRKYNYGMNEIKRKGWIEENGSGFKESEALIEQWTKELLTLIES